MSQRYTKISNTKTCRRGGVHDAHDVINASKIYFFASMDGFSMEAADAREPAGQDNAAVAERMFVLDTPMVNTVVADYSFVDNAMTASQGTWLETSVIATQLRQAMRDGRELIAVWQLPTLNVANIHVAPRQVIEAQWHHVRQSADSDTEDHSYSCIAADNRRRHMRRV